MISGACEVCEDAYGQGPSWLSCLINRAGVGSEFTQKQGERFSWGNRIKVTPMPLDASNSRKEDGHILVFASALVQGANGLLREWLDREFKGCVKLCELVDALKRFKTRESVPARDDVPVRINPDVLTTAALSESERQEAINAEMVRSNKKRVDREDVLTDRFTSLLWVTDTKLNDGFPEGLGCNSLEVLDLDVMRELADVPLTLSVYRLTTQNGVSHVAFVLYLDVCACPVPVVRVVNFVREFLHRIGDTPVVLDFVSHNVKDFAIASTTRCAWKSGPPILRSMFGNAPEIDDVKNPWFAELSAVLRPDFTTGLLCDGRDHAKIRFSAFQEVAMKTVCGPKFTQTVALFIRCELDFTVDAKVRLVEHCKALAERLVIVTVEGHVPLLRLVEMFKECVVSADRGSILYHVQGHVLVLGMIYALYGAGFLDKLNAVESRFMDMETSSGKRGRVFARDLATNLAFPSQFTCVICKTARLSDKVMESRQGPSTCDAYAMFEKCGDPELLVKMFVYLKGEQREKGWWKSKGFMTAHGPSESEKKYLADLPLLFRMMAVVVPQENVTVFDPMDVVEELGLGSEIAQCVWVKHLRTANLHFLRELWRRVFMTRHENGSTLWEYLTSDEDLLKEARIHGMEEYGRLIKVDIDINCLRLSWTRIAERNIMKQGQSFQLSCAHDAVSLLRTLQCTLKEALKLVPDDASIKEDASHLDALMCNGSKSITEMPKLALVGDSNVGKSFLIDGLARVTSTGEYQSNNRENVQTELIRDAESLLGSEHGVVVIEASRHERAMVSRNVWYDVGYQKAEIDRLEKEQDDNWKRFHAGMIAKDSLSMLPLRRLNATRTGGIYHTLP
jgi:hypothetical protein